MNDRLIRERIAFPDRPTIMPGNVVDPSEEPYAVEGQEDANLARPLATVPIVYASFQELFENSVNLRDRGIHFNAKSVVINNMTGQWYYASFLSCWIPPFIIGMTKNIPGGTQVIDFIQDTPTGQSSNGSNGQYFQCTVYSKNNVPDPGIIANPYTLQAALTPLSGEIAGAIVATQNPTVNCKWVKFKAAYDNAGRVYIGVNGVTKADGATDTTTGYQLSAGEETPWLPISNVNATYRICDNATDDVTYLGLV